MDRRHSAQTIRRKISKEFYIRMNRTSSLLTALVAGLFPMAVAAQLAPAPPAPAAQAAAIVPQAIPAKIALIAFEQAVFATNEGMRAVQDVQAKYAPKKAEIETLGNEVDTMKKQLQAAPATMPDDQRAALVKKIDTQEKKLTRDADDATNAYNADLQEAYSKVATKVNAVLRTYVQTNGYTLLLDVSGQQSPVMWAQENTDVTLAVVNAYNATSGVAAPPPQAPSAAKKPAASTPATRPASTAPKPATPPAAKPQ
jgi:Skp family chaperone for outer membrane proteins